MNKMNEVVETIIGSNKEITVEQVERIADTVPVEIGLDEIEKDNLYRVTIMSYDDNFRFDKTWKLDMHCTEEEAFNLCSKWGIECWGVDEEGNIVNFGWEDM